MTHLTVKTSFTLLQETRLCQRALSTWLLYHLGCTGHRKLSLLSDYSSDFHSSSSPEPTSSFKTSQAPYKNILRESAVFSRDQLPRLWEWKQSPESQNVFERNIRQITSLGFMAFHRMASYHS